MSPKERWSCASNFANFRAMTWEVRAIESMSSGNLKDGHFGKMSGTKMYQMWQKPIKSSNVWGLLAVSFRVFYMFFVWDQALWRVRLVMNHQNEALIPGEFVNPENAPETGKAWHRPKWWWICFTWSGCSCGTNKFDALSAKLNKYKLV